MAESERYPTQIDWRRRAVDGEEGDVALSPDSRLLAGSKRHVVLRFGAAERLAPTVAFGVVSLEKVPATDSPKQQAEIVKRS